MKNMDHRRMVNLLDKANKRDIWLPYWGDTAFRVLMPSQKLEEKEK